MSLPPPVAFPLRIHGLTKWFGETLALDALTLDVPPGSCFGLVGPNGSGKSTTLRSVIGLVRIDAGTIQVCGHDVATDVRAARSTTGVVLDPLQLFERLTATEFLRTIGELRELDRELVAERTTQLLTTLQLAADADRQIAGYSHGMRKKTSLAAALLHRPRLLLLDEPFEGVAPVLARRLAEAVARLKGTGLSVLLSESDFVHAADLVNRLFVIERGEVREVKSGVPSR
jgi:ABC-2 type transport system ATP-binding protein